MRCVRDYQLTQYLDHGCSPQEAEKIEAHLSTCGTCAARLESLRRRKEFVTRKAEILDPVDYPTEELPIENESDRLSAGVMTIESGWGMVRQALRPVAAALVLAVLIAGALVLGPQLFHRDEDGTNGFPGNGEQAHRQDIVRYVRVDGRPAQTVIIKEPEANTTIIWVEPN